MYLAYFVQQSDVDLLGQQVKKYSMKIELLNNNLQVINTLTGDVISGSWNNDSTSDIRRTLELTFLVKDSTYVIDSNSKIWLNRYIRPYIGIESIRDKTIHYYSLGLFVPYNNEFTYDTSTRILRVQANDFMYFLTQTKIGGAETIQIPAGSNIRSAMISVITELANVKKYSIGQVGNLQVEDAITVPYDLEFDAGSTVYDVISELRDLYVGWETYFDEDIFVCQSIPICSEDSVVLDYQTIIDKHLVVSEEISNTFEIYNVTEVFGSSIDCDYYTESCTLSGNEYYANIDGVTELESGTKYAVKLPSSNPENAVLNINGLGSYSIVDADGNSLNAGKIDGYSVFKLENNLFYYLGKYQVHAVCMYMSSEPSDEAKKYYESKFNCTNIYYRINPNSPYTVEKLATSSDNYYIDGIRCDVKTGGDYENIYSDSLALQRAKYENWKSARLTNSLILEMQVIPWLDVNQKISYKSKSENNIKEYIIIQISDDDLTDGLFQVELIQFYPTYPETYL